MSTYYDTLQIKTSPHKTGVSQIVYINSKWPIPSGTEVWFTIRKLDEDVKNTIRVKKTLHAVGTGRKVTCSKQWGYQPGDWAVITVTPIENDTRVEDQETD